MAERPAPVPTLDELVRHPERAAGLPLEAARALLTHCAQVGVVLLARFLDAAPDGAHGPPTAAGDRLLDVKDAARRLGVGPDWIYRRVTTLPFVTRLGRTVRVSEAGLERYLRSRHGR
jgi:predicted DNA-binding transcriptional regulator AlpA